MLDSKTKERIAQEAELPTHDDCEASKKSKQLNALERFIYDQEPVEDGEWREQLKAAIIEAREAEATRAAGLVTALEKTEAKINALIAEDAKGRAIAVAIIMANTLKEISQITTTALTKYNNQ